MAFCKSCGSQVPDGAANCPNCGAPVTGTDNYNYSGAQGQQNSFLGVDHTAEYDFSDIMANKWSHIIAYVGILFFLPIVIYPQSQVGRFHANQGLLLFLFNLAVRLVNTIIGFLGGAPVIGWIMLLLANVISWLGWLIVLAGFIYALVNILNNKVTELPIIGKIRLIK